MDDVEITVDYDYDTFTIEKDGKSYTYDMDREIELYNRILSNDAVDYEVYSQLEEVDQDYSDYEDDWE